MGVDIHGWVEITDPAWTAPIGWQGVISIAYLIQRSYGMFGSLFGVRNADGFLPLAANRGIPPDASPQMKAEIMMREDETVTPSWLVAPSWILWSEIRAIDWNETGTDVIPPDTRPQTRRQQITPRWRMLFDMMRLLAKHFGAQNVRLVVWFDSL